MSKKARLKAELLAAKEEESKKTNWQRIGIKAGATLLVLLMLVGVLGQLNMLPKTTGSGGSFFGLLPDPTPTPTPVVLSKEYLYAGSRMLSVEDANTQAISATDLAVFRQDNGTWWILNGLSGATSGNYWGTSGDIAVPADFDGDGHADVAVWRPTTGVWYIIQSSNWAAQYGSLGTSGDKPVPADYDGDGKADVAVWRPSTGVWYINQSSDNQPLVYQYGVSTDIPAQADYDGDGKADMAVYRPSTSEFFILQTSNNLSRVETFGTTNSTPVQGDYDGDGIFDLALKNGNVWKIKSSSSGTTTDTTWQEASDKSVQGDYDADGKTDIAVWRDSNGMWFILQSATNTLRQSQWGMSGDTPVPAPYRR